MNQATLFFDNVCAFLIHKTNELGDRAFVARNDAGGKYDGVARFDGHAFVELRRHLIKGGARLSLRSGNEKNDLVIRHRLRLVDVDEHSTMNVEITKPLGYLDILLHRTPKHADLPTELLRHIEHDL